MKKPTTKQIEAEIRALDECLKFVPKYSKFQEHNHEAINAGISALADRLTVDIAYEMADAEEPSNCDNARIEAAQWMVGEIEESPSSG